MDIGGATVTIHMPKGYQDPSEKSEKNAEPGLVEITGMWATLACTALCVILLVYKLINSYAL